MFDRGFGPEVKAILAAVRGKPSPARCVLVSATMTKAVRRLIGGCAVWKAGRWEGGGGGWGGPGVARHGHQLGTPCWQSGCFGHIPDL